VQAEATDVGGVSDGLAHLFLNCRKAGQCRKVAAITALALP